MAAPGPGSRKKPGLQAGVERLPAEQQARPRRHIAAPSGRDRVMAETYGETGGPKTRSGSGPREDAACGNGAGLYMPGGGVCRYGAGPSGFWEGFGGSEAELNRFGRSLRVLCVG